MFLAYALFLVIFPLLPSSHFTHSLLLDVLSKYDINDPTSAIPELRDRAKRELGGTDLISANSLHSIFIGIPKVRGLFQWFCVYIKRS